LHAARTITTTAIDGITIIPALFTITPALFTITPALFTIIPALFTVTPAFFMVILARSVRISVMSYSSRWY